jgi:hypothetical protein
MNMSYIPNRQDIGTADGRGGEFKTRVRADGVSIRGELESFRELTETERFYDAAQQNLAEQRIKFDTSSTTLVLDGQLKELEDRGDKVVSIAVRAIKKIIGSPEWEVTSMITADGRNLVTGMHLDVNSAESRAIDMLECIGDHGSDGIPAWFGSSPDGETFSVDLGKIRADSRDLGVDDDAEARCPQRKEQLKNIVAERELAGSEYTLAAAALVTEGILAKNPDTDSIVFRYENGAFITMAVTNNTGGKVFGSDKHINDLLNKILNFEDPRAKPIDSSGNPAEEWFIQPGRVLASYKLDLLKAQKAAESYR